jgi:hypothetical protein
MNEEARVMIKRWEQLKRWHCVAHAVIAEEVRLKRWERRGESEEVRVKRWEWRGDVVAYAAVACGVVAHAAEEARLKRWRQRGNIVTHAAIAGAVVAHGAVAGAAVAHTAVTHAVVVDAAVADATVAEEARLKRRGWRGQVEEVRLKRWRQRGDIVTHSTVAGAVTAHTVVARAVIAHTAVAHAVIAHVVIADAAVGEESRLKRWDRRGDVKEATLSLTPPLLVLSLLMPPPLMLLSLMLPSLMPLSLTRWGRRGGVVAHAAAAEEVRLKRRGWRGEVEEVTSMRQHRHS